MRFEPREWQRKADRLMKRFNLLLVSRQSGKTVLSIAKLLEDAQQNTRPNPRYAYVDPYLKQARKVGWLYFKEMTADIPGVEQVESRGLIRFTHNNAEVELEGADTPDSLRGTYLDGVVLDEFEDMKPDVWEAITLPKLLSRGGWAIIQGTLHGVGNLSQQYFKALRDPDWYAGNFTAIDTGYPGKEALEIAERNMSARRFAQEYMNDLNAGSADALLSLMDVANSQQKLIQRQHYEFAPLIMGVDIGRGGDDPCSICFRQGLRCENIETFAWSGDTETASYIGSIAQRRNPDAIFVDDTGGYGAMACAKLRELGFRVQGVNFASKPIDDRYTNKRVEMWWQMAQWVKGEGRLPVDQELAIDLTCVKYDHDNAKGKLYLESKEDIKKRIGRSTDRGDSLALTFAFPVFKASPDEQMGERLMQNIQNRGNPLTRELQRSGMRSNPLTRARESAGLR